MQHLKLYPLLLIIALFALILSLANLQQVLAMVDQTSDSVVPLAIACEPPSTLCLFGYVYQYGVPTANIDVFIESPYGSLLVTSQGGTASSYPYFVINLSAPPLLASVGDTIVLSASSNGQQTGTSYVALPGGQQIDLVFAQSFDDWWDTSYPYRRALPITTGSTIAAGTIMKINGLDMSTLVSAGKMRADHNDLRIVRRIAQNNWQEVARADYADWDVEFKLAVDIAPGIDTSYYLHYGNAGAASPPTFSLPQGWWVDMYRDKWWTDFGGTWTFDQGMNFDNVCDPGLDHDGKIGSSFDESDRFRGRIFIPSTGSWTFQVYTNDGYRLSIDGSEVGHFDGYEGNRNVTIGSMNLQSGWHEMDLRNMWVNCGAWKFYMEGPSFGNQIVPAHYFQQVQGVWSGITPDAEEDRNATYPPMATFVKLSPASLVLENETVILYGRGVDNDENGSTITNYVWRTDNHGVLGTSDTLSIPASSLGLGERAIYFKVRDDEGTWSNEISRTLTIQAVTPTSTRTDTPEPPTATATFTSKPPTPTNTYTPKPPTATATFTPRPPTPTKTFTSIPPTATYTKTPVVPSPTNTVPTATKTQTPTATPTIPTPSGDGDSYEEDDSCAHARSLAINGATQEHSFHRPADEDWVRFDAQANVEYLIEGRVPANADTNLVIEVRKSCQQGAQTTQGYAFSPDVRVEFTSSVNSTIFLRLLNDNPDRYGEQSKYTLSLRNISQAPPMGAVIIAGGRIKTNDPLQANIDRLTTQAFKMWYIRGYSTDRIQFLSSDLSLDATEDQKPDVDGLASKSNLQAAITEWAKDKVSSEQSLTLYLVDHGNADLFYLDKPNRELLRPADLDTWLDQLQTAVPGLRVNIIIEACYSGSFIKKEQSISGANRVILTSTTAEAFAWASDKGAYFSDVLFNALQQGSSLLAAFKEAQLTASTYNESQRAWLDDNGDGVYDRNDGAFANQIGFFKPGSFMPNAWPPYVVEADIRDVGSGRYEIWANALDDEEIATVWAEIYPPSYQPPAASEELAPGPVPLSLSNRGNDWYASLYGQFNEIGEYRIILYAEDATGLRSHSLEVKFETGQRVYLPLVVR